MYIKLKKHFKISLQKTSLQIISNNNQVKDKNWISNVTQMSCFGRFWLATGGGKLETKNTFRSTHFRATHEPIYKTWRLLELGWRQIASLVSLSHSHDERARKNKVCSPPHSQCEVPYILIYGLIQRQLLFSFFFYNTLKITTLFVDRSILFRLC